MPYVNIKITGGEQAPTQQQKELLIHGVTKLLEDVLGKNPKATTVIIDEIHPSNWGLGGESLTQRAIKK